MRRFILLSPYLLQLTDDKIQKKVYFQSQLPNFSKIINQHSKLLKSIWKYFCFPFNSPACSSKSEACKSFLSIRKNLNGSSMTKHFFFCLLTSSLKSNFTQLFLCMFVSPLVRLGRIAFSTTFFTFGEIPNLIHCPFSSCCFDVCSIYCQKREFKLK